MSILRPSTLKQFPHASLPSRHLNLRSTLWQLALQSAPERPLDARVIASTALCRRPGAPRGLQPGCPPEPRDGACLP